MNEWLRGPALLAHAASNRDAGSALDAIEASVDSAMWMPDYPHGAGTANV